MQISVILAIMIALLAGESVQAGNPETEWFSSPGSGQSLLILAGSMLLVWSFWRVITRLILARLEGMQWPNRSVMKMPGRVDLVFQIMLLTVFTIQLTVGGWAELICTDLGLGGTVLLWEVGLILPYVLMLILKWHCFYPINRFFKENIIAGQLAEGLSARPVWSCGQYILFNVRHGLLIFLAPLLLIFTFRDTVALIFGRWFSENPLRGNAEEGIVLAGVIGIFIFSPWLLRRVWSTRTLPAGPLRERLEVFCRRLKLKYHDLLLWNTYSAVANAAMMGLFPPVRYILLSDQLIENMPDEQIEAVFGHEIGHVKHHHILFLVLFIMGSSFCGMLLYAFCEWLMENHLAFEIRGINYNHYILSGSSVLMIVGWFLVFGWVSRRFERQADVYGAGSVARGPEAEGKELLNVHGAMVMGAALERIAMLNGISAYSRSWRHSSIASRIGFLRRLASEGGAYSRFQRTLVLVKTGIVLLVLVGASGYWLVNSLAKEAV